MTANTPSPRLRLTLFDLDHTLLPIDSDHAWGAFTTRIGWTDPAEFERRNDAFYADYQAGTLDVHDYLPFSTPPLRPPPPHPPPHRRFLARFPGRPPRGPRLRALCHRSAAPARARGGRGRPGAIHARGHQPGAPAPGAGAGATAPAGGRRGADRHRHQRLRDPAHCLGAGRGRRRAAGHAVGARRQRLVQRRDRRLALHARGQTAAHGTMAGRPATGLGGCRKPLLQRFDERPVPAGKGRPPRRHQPRAAPAGAGARAGLAHTRPVWHTMIKKFIDKLLGKSMPGSTGGKPHFGRREEVPASVHGIDPELVDRRAADVVATLKQAGFAAYIVGGAVRDLLLGLRPKDFDVATDATPEQVKSLFRRAFIIGRRFRIVHVVHGRGREHEVIEVSPFRAYLDNAAAGQVSGNEKTSKAQLSGMQHAVDASGRVLRDNVWGPQDEDAPRRDFTINAMYYDPVSQIVVDYHKGLQDARKKTLRMIGEPTLRYREDPVRIIRAVRFAAKLSALGFAIDAKTAAPLRQSQALLADVPQSRMFDEMLKLLQTGHAIATIEQLRKLGLTQGIYPLLDLIP